MHEYISTRLNMTPDFELALFSGRLARFLRQKADGAIPAYR